jgi:catechol 2,3-dioxygenase-like lactoylglutathione lyase family enzyme
MKRLHVHVSVRNLDASVRFYSRLFATDPTVRKSDYARWMLEDPRVNFAISQRSDRPGLQHLGVQVGDRAELTEVYGRLRGVDAPVLEQRETTCCYARSEKSWVYDPQGLPWEVFLTTGDSVVYGTDEILPGVVQEAAAGCGETNCCAGTRVRGSDT